MDGESSSSKHYKLESILQSQSSEPQNLPLKDLKEITKDFSEEHLLGRGGFGAVYKGVLPNGDIIAVKKLTWTMSGIQDKQYENEARHLMRLKHPNIVQLLGYCSETETELVQHKGKYVRAEKPERLLCLEYLPKGSLCRHLSDESCGLDWNTRYKIIEGICYGLHYLHEEWHSTPIIHRDLTPANILLDDNMVPKIADFGLSRLFSEQQTRTITKNHYGTLGYMSPEYLNRGIITKELDIFSLGVIIIQIITGDKHYPDKVERSSEEFIELVLMNWRNRLEKVPGATSQEFDCQQIRRCIEIGLLCVKLDRAERPTTSKIIEMLASDGAESSNKGVDQMDSPVPDDGSSRGGSPQRGGGPPLKKGPWTSAEDTILVDYVKKHGVGNWNAVQKNTRLFRCGKSCRLRWVNYLRPNLKKGAFSTEEERLIIELHTMMGNKWVRIAAHLPGRTSNEIKNYWRTRIKRCQRAGLPIIPIYPASVYNQSLNED